jgi:hypothetical protein
MKMPVDHASVCECPQMEPDPTARPSSPLRRQPNSLRRTGESSPAN